MALIDNEKLYFPSSSTESTAVIYGYVINGKSIFKTLRVALSTAFILKDFLTILIFLCWRFFSQFLHHIRSQISVQKSFLNLTILHSRYF